MGTPISLAVTGTGMVETTTSNLSAPRSVDTRKPPPSTSIPRTVAPVRTSTPSATSAFSMIEYIRSEEHTSELQSLMRISYAVFCLNKKKQLIKEHTSTFGTQSYSQQHIIH